MAKGNMKVNFLWTKRRASAFSIGKMEVVMRASGTRESSMGLESTLTVIIRDLITGFGTKVDVLVSGSISKKYKVLHRLAMSIHRNSMIHKEIEP